MLRCICGSTIFTQRAAPGSIFAVFLIGVIVTPLAGRAIFRFGYKTTFMAACCSTGVFAGQACTTSYAALTAGQAKSSGVGLYLTCYYLGGNMGAILPAPIFHRWGWFGCITLFFIVFSLGLIAAVRYWPNLKRYSASVESIN